jgi:hypothetical protein
MRKVVATPIAERGGQLRSTNFAACAAHTPETPGLAPRPYEQSCSQCPTRGQSPKRDPGLAAPSTRPAPTVAARRPARPSASASGPRQRSDRQDSDPGSRRSHARAKILALSSNDPSSVHHAGYAHRLPSSRCRGASALADCARPRFIIRRSTRAPFQSSRRIIRRTIPPCPRLLPQSILSMMQRAPVH